MYGVLQRHELVKSGRTQVHIILFYSKVLKYTMLCNPSK